MIFDDSYQDTYYGTCFRRLKDVKPVIKRPSGVRAFCRKEGTDHSTLVITLFQALWYDDRTGSSLISLSKEIWAAVKRRKLKYELTLGAVVMNAPGTIGVMQKGPMWFFEQFGAVDPALHIKVGKNNVILDVMKTVLDCEERFEQCSSENLLRKLLEFAKMRVRVEYHMYYHLNRHEPFFKSLPLVSSSIWRFFEEKTRLASFPDSFVEEVEANDEVLGDDRLAENCQELSWGGVKYHDLTPYSALHMRIRLISKKFHSQLKRASLHPSEPLSLPKTCSRLVFLGDLPTLKYIEAIMPQDYNEHFVDFDVQQNPFLAALVFDRLEIAKYMLQKDEPFIITEEIHASIAEFLEGGEEQLPKYQANKTKILKFLSEILS